MGFEDVPKSGAADEEEKPLALETPGEEEERLRKLKETQESVPGESEGATKNYIEAQERAADAASAYEAVQEEAVVAFQRDEAAAKEVLKNIQEAPIAAEPRVTEKVSTEAPQAKEESVSGFKKLLKKLKFWEREEFSAAEQLKKHDIAKNIASGNITEARSMLVSRELPKRTNEDKEALMAEFENMVSAQVETLVKANDTEQMKMLIQNNNLDYIGSRNLASMPKEVIQSPEVQSRLTSHLEYFFGNPNLEYGVNKANEYVKLGLMSAESVQALVQSEAVQNKFAETIKGTFSGNLEYGVNKANEYVKLGLMSAESVQALVQSEPFQKIVTGALEREFSGVRATRANEYVRLGIISREKADQLLSRLQAK